MYVVEFKNKEILIRCENCNFLVLLRKDDCVLILFF